MQRWKHHPLIAEVLEGGERVSYGAWRLLGRAASIADPYSTRRPVNR